MRSNPKLLTPRKLLVAVASVATVNLAACEKRPPTSGNLMAPDPQPTTVQRPPTSGNLMAPTAEPLGPTDAAAPIADAKDAGAEKDAGAAKDAGAKAPPKAAPLLPPKPRPPTSGNLMAPSSE